MAAVSYKSKRTIVSSRPVEAGKYYHLSVFDRIMEQNHVRIVYYYRCGGGKKVGELTKRLRNSLSHVLTCFPALTGRLVKDKEGQWMVKCNDAGVRLVDAKAKGSVEDWLKNVDRDKELMLVHWEYMDHKPYFWSTFYVQLTEFEDGGLAIGLSCSHLLVDPICATMFIKAWADLSLARKIYTPPLFHELPPPRLNNQNLYHTFYFQLINHYKSFNIENSHSFITNTMTKPMTLTFLFTDHMVQACMAMAESSSPFETLAGLFWICLSKIKGADEKLLRLSICLDMRKVLCLDKGYFGNCMVYNKVHADTYNELPDVVAAITQAIAKMDYDGIMDLIQWLKSNDIFSLTTINNCDLVCYNLEGLIDPNWVMFEEGFAPIRVSCYVEPTLGSVGQIMILPSPLGEGPRSKVVMVTLWDEKSMVKLREDNLLQQFSPTILMEINK